MFLCSRKKTNDEISRIAVQNKNRKFAERFAATSCQQRIIFVPHCMRNIEKCRAKEMGSYYTCAECGACKIGPISKKAAALGYKALFILKGGRTVEKLIQELKPAAIVGVACYYEGAQGFEQGEKHQIVVQFVPLTRDGCANTDVDLNDVYAVLEKQQK